MAAIVTMRRRVRQQPQRLLQIDRSNPITRALETLLPLAGHTHDAVTGMPWTVTQGAAPLTYGVGALGRGMLATASATPSYVSRTQPSAITSSSSQAITMRYRLVFPVMPPNMTSCGVMQWADTAGSGAPRYYVRMSGQANGSGILDFYFLTGYRGPVTVQPGAECIILHAFDGVTHTIYVNGVSIGSFTGTWTDNAGAFFLGRGYNSPAGTFILSDFGVWSRGLSANEARIDAANIHRLHKAPRRMLQIGGVAAPADTSLAGTASSVLSASGSLSTSIRLAGAAGLQVSASGALSTAIRLAGSASSIFTASGSLSGSAAALTGTAVFQVAASGSLSTSIPLAGTAFSSVTASGTLAGSGAALTGTAVVQVSGSGSLTTSISFAGSAALRVSASASLASFGAVLAGTALVRVSATGALSTSVPSVVIDASKVPLARTVTFNGCIRTVVFKGGIRTVVFAGGTRTVRF
jgi:hypothetical protein